MTTRSHATEAVTYSSQDAGSLNPLNAGSDFHPVCHPRDLHGAGSRLHSIHSSLLSLARRYKNTPQLAQSFQRSADHYARLIALDENAGMDQETGKASTRRGERT
jgi:hypothetical protein